MIDCVVNILNKAGLQFCQYALTMLLQSGAVITVLLLIDLLIRKRVRAIFRYCILMLVFVKLILPPTFYLPTGIGRWCGDYLSADSAILKVASVLSGVETAENVAVGGWHASSQAHRVSPKRSHPQLERGAGYLACAPPNVTWPAVALLIWLVTVLVLSVLLLERMWFVAGLIRQSEPAKGRIVGSLEQCRSRVGIRNNIELKISHNVESPAVCGLFRPKILLPASLPDGLSRHKLQTVLIHELAHIKRGDLWVNLVQTVLQIIYFYNPLVWLANSAVRSAREQAVDETALACLGAQAGEYGNTLIDIAEIAHARPSLSLRLIGVVESKKALARRIEHIINRPLPRSPRLGTTGALVVIVAALVLLPMARGQTTITPPDQTAKNKQTGDAIKSGGIETSGGIAGFVADKSGKPCADVYITESLGDFTGAVKSNEQGRFSLPAPRSGQKTWLAYSEDSRAVGIFNISPNDRTPLGVVLKFNEARIRGRIIKPNGKGVRDRKVEFIITSAGGRTYHLPSNHKTDEFGNYHGIIPSGSGLTVRSRLLDGTETERKYIARPVSLTDNQSFIPMPLLIIWPAQQQGF